MRIELAAPCCLTLAAARADGRPALLGIALRHPPVQLEALPSDQLLVSGARADAAYAAAERYADRHGLAGAALEIELAIPSQMGLGSTALAGLSAARALAALHGLPAADAPALAAAAGLAADDGLAVQAFARGGLVAVDEAGSPLRHAPIAHGDEARDWVFVMALPRVPPGTPADLEEAGRRALWAAAGRLGAAAEQAGAELWQAVAGDDLPAFAGALGRLQALGDPPALSPGEAAALELMREHGALLAGRAPTGLALYALVAGAEASRRLRRALAAHLGHMGGIVMATICDTAGARHRSVGGGA